MNVAAEIRVGHHAGEVLRQRGLLACVLVFWAVQFSALTVQQLLMWEGRSLSMMAPRACVTLIGVGISLAIARIVRRLPGRRLRSQLAFGAALALAGAFVHALGNFTVFQIFIGDENMSSFTLESYFGATLQWFWSYAALLGMLLALSYSLELAEMHRVAHTAQMRALRYQLNPHFMFNTLNSIAALVSRKDVETAEHMVENLGDFLRATLSLDPQEDIPLQREIALQSLYLEIERLRFSDRLTVELDIASDAMGALVPSLITQPLAENVIRHAVAHSTRPIAFSITARRDGQKLRITARNSAPDGRARRSASTGVGLANVAERLTARFGDSASFAVRGEPDGAFVVEMAMPFNAAADR
ncbi:MAG: histidine kinase [Alphaproteobacteria bacterium]|nr:histidine kinase [Alphaproteobacteria bacterium]MBV9372525.1 histidine kinase [Alphaproteobacteria bacterium]MBV9902246.1 histidine kinase [Alphaproteobacteria bacterium]